MKTKLFILATCLWVAVIGVPGAVVAQKALLLKAGPEFATGSYNTLGFGTGVEVSLGKRASLSAVLNYKKGLTADQEIIDKLINSYDDRSVLSHSFGLSLDFRFYFQKNIFYPLEGFFMGLGAEVGKGNFRRPVMVQTYDPVLGDYIEYIELNKEQYMYLQPGISLGFAKSISDKCSFEVSSGCRIELYGENLFIPVQANFRYNLN